MSCVARVLKVAVSSGVRPFSLKLAQNSVGVMMLALMTCVGSTPGQTLRI